MGIISVEQVDHLYWLGRYSERVYTTLQIFAKSFDVMIDSADEVYPKYCEALDIPNIYESKEDFLKRYPFDDCIPDSIISNLNRAYDNAIVLRETIGSDALSYIQLALYAMNKASVSDSPLIELQQIVDNLYSFWGIIDDQIESEQIRNIIKAGKRIERIDLYARLELDKVFLEREIRRMIPRVLRSGLKYNKSALDSVCSLANDSILNYNEILLTVEKIVA
ncbi:MAG: alpha-E domain-containing protein [Butyrivibrio sp.]|uniref:alpha-E domain-containing protein n=1 Tax=Butyrivibrio sp. TaxID=28121 RepID=UPI0025F67B64|nr:alpha-E domain-containing protein [Butyrivibrio sp.]MCR5770518.1 alpha-E domain-containing protein [Butyrivibrio sp.]